MKRLAAELAPYFALRRPVLRLARGSWALARRLFDICMAGEGADKAWRALGAVFAGSVTWKTAERVPLVMLPVTLAWLVFAWRYGRPTPAGEEPAPADDGQEQPEPVEEEPEEQPLPDVEQLTAALHAVGDPHAHLSALAAHLGLGKDATPVRAALEGAGIPVDPVRVRGRGVSTGVKRDHFPPLLPSPSDSPDGVVVAGQPDNNNTEGRKPYLSREGFWTTPDPERPHGWNVAAPRT